MTGSGQARKSYGYGVNATFNNILYRYYNETVLKLKTNQNKVLLVLGQRSWGPKFLKDNMKKYPIIICANEIQELL